MMKTSILFIIALIAGVSVFAEAPARSKGSFKKEPADTLNSDIEALIKALSDKNTSTPPPERVVQTSDILDLVIGATVKDSKRIIKEPKETSSAGVLDFMTRVYADHGFYQSGRWEDAEDWSTITRNIVLPDYDPNDFHRPVWGKVTSTYGFRPKFGRMHKGIDLALNIGDTVRAALPGVVAKIGYDVGGYGHYVVLLHNNGMETRYAHLSAPISTLGETLKAGDPLGLGGNTGNSTGPHLHFEVRYRGTALDPASVFKFNIPPAVPYQPYQPEPRSVDKSAPHKN